MLLNCEVCGARQLEASRYYYRKLRIREKRFDFENGQSNLREAPKLEAVKSKSVTYNFTTERIGIALI